MRAGRDAACPAAEDSGGDAPRRRGRQGNSRRPDGALMAGARTQGEAARLGSARLGSARLGSARLGSARLGSARLGSARLGSARQDCNESRFGVCQPPCTDYFAAPVRPGPTARDVRAVHRRTSRHGQGKSADEPKARAAPLPSHMDFPIHLPHSRGNGDAFFAHAFFATHASVSAARASRYAYGPPAVLATPPPPSSAASRSAVSAPNLRAAWLDASRRSNTGDHAAMTRCIRDALI